MRKFVLIPVALILVGCATSRNHRIPLDQNKVARIHAQARPAAELKITVTVDTQDQPSFGNIHNVPLGMSGDIRLLTPPGSPTPEATTRAKLGAMTLKAVIDSAMPSTVIDYYGAQLAALPPLTYTLTEEADATAHLAYQEHPGPAGPLYEYTCLARSVALGDITLYNVPVGILDDERGFNSLWWLDGDSADLVIGNDVLQAFDYVTFDFPNGTVRPASGRYHPTPAKLLAAVPIVGTASIPLVEAYIDDLGPCLLALSTGADCGLWLPGSLASDLALPDAQPSSMHKSTSRKPAPMALPAGLRRVNISGFELPDVPTTVGLEIAGDDEVAPYGILGRNILGQYVTTIDFKAGKVYLERP